MGVCLNTKQEMNDYSKNLPKLDIPDVDFIENMSVEEYQEYMEDGEDQD
jgi:hypothetical protein